MNLVEDRGMTLGFRPEHFRPAEGAAPGAFRTPFRIDNVEYLGADRLLYGELGGRFAGRTAFSRLAAHVAAPRVGDTLDFVVEEGKARFFDSTGRRAGPRTPETG
jgi:multiple sugar transport system ATP-binding protein